MMRFKLTLGALVLLWFGSVYLLSDRITALSPRIHSVKAPFDDCIPFIPEFSVAYLSVFALVLLPLIFIRSKQRFLALGIAVSAGDHWRRWCF